MPITFGQRPANLHPARRNSSVSPLDRAILSIHFLSGSGEGTDIFKICVYGCSGLPSTCSNRAQLNDPTAQHDLSESDDPVAVHFHKTLILQRNQHGLQ
jgi:hypothetical protein